MSEGPHRKGPTSMLRAYRGDMPLIARTVRRWAAERNVKLSAADVIHELLEPLRQQEREQERGNG